MPRLTKAVAGAACVLVGLPFLAGVVYAETSPVPETTFVSAPPPGASGPDDITRLATDGVDHGAALIWVGFQNGIGPDGTPAPGGPATSTLAGYDPTTGALVETIPVTGKVDGLTADQDFHRLIATVNEDNNSAVNLVDPETRAVTTYAYRPSPAVAGVGGTDSIAVKDDGIYVAHSNPSDTTQPTEYKVSLDNAARVAHLHPVFFNDGSATDAVTGKPVQLALTDPDTNFVMPSQSPRFGGELATISQADGEIIFASHPRRAPGLRVLHLTDNVPGNVPPADGLAVATSHRGTLYVVDAAAGKVQALDTSNFPAGTVFVGEPSDNGNPLVGTLDLASGRITPFANTFGSPKGLLFVPAATDHGDGE